MHFDGTVRVGTSESALDRLIARVASGTVVMRHYLTNRSRADSLVPTRTVPSKCILPVLVAFACSAATSKMPILSDAVYLRDMELALAHGVKRGLCALLQNQSLGRVYQQQIPTQ